MFGRWLRRKPQNDLVSIVRRVVGPHLRAIVVFDPAGMPEPSLRSADYHPGADAEVLVLIHRRRPDLEDHLFDALLPHQSRRQAYYSLLIADEADVRAAGDPDESIVARILRDGVTLWERG